MKVLALTRYGRLGASSRMRFYQFPPALEQSGIHVDVSPLLPDAYLARIYTHLPKDWRAIGGYYLSRMFSLLNANKYDLLWIEKELLPNIGETDVGRQIMLYWDPFFTLAGGPTNHFDMTGYLYFGPYLGTLFVVGLAFFLAQVNRLKQHQYNTVGCALVAVLYCRSLAVLLNPATGIALTFDVFVVFLLMAIFARLIHWAALNPSLQTKALTGDLG